MSRILLILTLLLWTSWGATVPQTCPTPILPTAEYDQIGGTYTESIDLIVAADMNNDGIMDGVVCHWRTPDTVSLFYTSPDGVKSRTRKAAYAVGGRYGHQVAVGHFNNDAHLDVLLPTYYQQERLHFYAGDGTGALANYAIVANGPKWVANMRQYDIDGDNIHDLVYSERHVSSGAGGLPTPPTSDRGAVFWLEGGSWVVHRVSGPHTFTPLVAAGLFDNDDLTDIVYNVQPATITIVHGPGSHDYYNDGVVSTISVPANLITYINVMDANSDGQDDIAVVTDTGDYIMYLGPNPATKEGLTFAISGDRRFLTIDINRDGVAELITQGTFGITISRVATLDPLTYFPETIVPVPVEPSHLGIYDSTGDSYLDIAVQDNSHENNRRMYVGQPIGPFSSFPGPSPVYPDHASHLVSADLDADGWLDLLLIDDATGSLYILYNTGDGQLASDAPVLLANATLSGTSFSTAHACDVDSDGTLDIVALAPTTDPHSLFWLRGGEGSTPRSFASPSLLASTSGIISSPPDTVAPLSLNGDNHVDFVLASSATGSIATLFGSGDSTAAPNVPLPLTNNVHPSLLLASPLSPLYPPPPSTPPTTAIVYVIPGSGDLYANATLLGSDANLVGATALAMAQMDAQPGMDLVWAAPGLGGVAWASSSLDPDPTALYDLASPSIISFGGADVTHVTIVYATFDGMASVIGTTASGTDILWAVPVSALNARLSNRIHSVVSGASGLGPVVATDVVKHGLSGVVVSSASSGVVFLEQSLTFASAQASARILSLDAPECGGIPHTMVCVAAALARASLCTPFPPVLDLPDVPITNCVRSGRAVGVAGHVTLRGASNTSRAVFDCGVSGGGVLFRVLSGAEVALENVNVVGASATGADSPVMVDSGATLTLNQVTFQSCSASPATFTTESGQGGAVHLLSQSTLRATHVSFVDNTAAGSGGAVAAVGSGIHLWFSHVVFERNTASGLVGGINSGGGAVAILGPASKLDMDDVRVSDSRATAGSGGALLVRGASTTAELVDVNVIGCTAGLAGGALGVVSGSLTSIQWRSGSVSGTHAVWGGVIAVAAYDVFPATPEAAALGGTSGNIGASVSLDPDVVLGGATGQYGAFGMVCDAILSIPSWANVSGTFAAEVAGGRLFVCSEGDALWTAGVQPVDPSRVGTRWQAGGYGAVDASPPAVVSLVSPFPVSAPSGADMVAQAIVYDAFGSVTVDASTLVVADPLAVGQLVLTTEAKLDTESGVYSVVVTASVVDWPDTLDSVHRFVLGSRSGSGQVVEVVLTACPPGLGRAGGVEDPLSCRECTGTSFSRNTSTSPCDVPLTCAGTAVLVGSECVECPVRSVVAPNATAGVLDCECIAGAWADPALASGDLVVCLPCPVGGVCAGGEALPTAAPGYYPLQSAGEFTECPVEEACTGNGQCKTGYAASFACKDCSSGYHRVADGTCEQCPSQAYTMVVILGALLAGVATVSFVVSYLAVKRTVKLGGRTASLVPYSVSVLLLWIQTVALLYADSITWPSQVRETLRVFTLANIDISFFAVGCAGLPFSALFTLKVVLPLVFAAAVVLNALLYIGLRKKKEGEAEVNARAVLIRLGSVMVPFLYIPISRVTLEFFDCTKLDDGKWYMDAALDVECGSEEWLTMLPLAVGAFMVYVAGAPVLVGTALFRSRRRLDEAMVRAKLGPLYESYRSEFYLFELFQLVWKRLSVVATTLFFSTIPVVLFSGLILSFLTTLQVVTRLQPFRRARHNSLDARLALSLLVLAILGTFFWADAFSSDGMKTVFVVITLSVLVVSLILLLTAVVIDVMSEARSDNVVGVGEGKFGGGDGGWGGGDEDGEDGVTMVGWAFDSGESSGSDDGIGSDGSDGETRSTEEEEEESDDEMRRSGARSEARSGARGGGRTRRRSHALT